MTQEVLIPWWQGLASRPLHGPCRARVWTLPGKLPGCPHARLPCPGPRQPPHSRSDSSFLLRGPSPSQAGSTPSGAPQHPSGRLQPPRPNFPCREQPRPGPSVHLAPGLEKPRSVTAVSGSQQPISCAKRPTRNSFQRLPPSCQHLLAISAPGPGPTQAGGGHRQGPPRPIQAHAAARTCLQAHLQKQIPPPERMGCTNSSPTLPSTCAAHSHTQTHVSHPPVPSGSEWSPDGGRDVPPWPSL